MQFRSRMFSSSSFSSLFSLAAVGLMGVLMMGPRAVEADLTCTQVGSDTFRVNSTVKFQWNDTMSTTIDTFSLNLYCVQNSQLVQAISYLNSSSPSPVVWVVTPSFLTSVAASSCSLNQFQGAFEWTTTDSDTGAAIKSSAKCKVLLFINGSTTRPAGSSTGNPSGTDQLPGTEDDEPRPTNIEVSEKTRNILIGVGCAVGVLVLAGIVGFYVIRYSNRRAEEDNTAKKLREPLRDGPMFPASMPPPRDRTGGPGGPVRNSRYHELASVTTSTSASMDSPTIASNKAEMVELGPYKNSAPAGSLSPTPIAAAHAKLSNSNVNTPTLSSASVGYLNPSNEGNGNSSNSSSSSSNHNGVRPGSLLTSSFVPAGERPTSNPFERRDDYEIQQVQQQQQHQHQQQQLQQQQHQQQQQQQAYGYQY